MKKFEGIVMLLLFFAFGSVNCELLDLIKSIKCKLEDTACLTASAQKAVPEFMSGIPEIGVEVMDILELEFIKFDLSGLQFTLADGRLAGLKNLVLESMKWDLDKKSIQAIYYANYTLTGHYTAGGRILILPITGDGQLKLKLTKLWIKFKLDYVLKKRNGKEFVHLTRYEFHFDIIDNAHYHLTNLFNGNKELGDAMHNFLNENWKQVTAEFGTPIINATAKKLYKNVERFFNTYPITELNIE